MSQSNSFWSHPIERLEEALSIRKQIAALQSKLGGLLGDSSPATPSSGARKGGRRKGRVVSAEARAKMAASQKARWAKGKAASAPAVKAIKAPKKKGGLTPEGRAKLAAAMKARWAARKKGAAPLNAPKK